MSIFTDVLPEAWRPYAKAVIALVGAVLSAVTLVIPDAPEWVTAAVGILTALGVYQTPNEETPAKHLAD